MAGDVFWKNYFLLCNLRLSLSAFIAQNADILCTSTGILFRFGNSRCREHKEGWWDLILFKIQAVFGYGLWSLVPTLLCFIVFQPLHYLLYYLHLCMVTTCPEASVVWQRPFSHKSKSNCSAFPGHNGTLNIVYSVTNSICLAQYWL